MDKPPDFPDNSWAAVSAVRFRAAAVLKSDVQIERSEQHPNFFALALSFVLNVFKAFAHEACVLGRKGEWKIEKIDAECQSFLAEAANDAHVICAELGLSIPDMFYLSETGVRCIKPDVVRLLKRTTEYEAYDAEAYEVAMLQSSVTDAKKRPASSEPHPELLENVETLNKAQAASALGVSIRTLDRYVEDRRLTPTGSYPRKRFKTQDLKKFLTRRKQGQARHTET